MTHEPAPDEFGALLSELQGITRRIAEIDGRITALAEQRVETLRRTLGDLEQRVPAAPETPAARPHSRPIVVREHGVRGFVGVWRDARADGSASFPVPVGTPLRVTDRVVDGRVLVLGPGWEGWADPVQLATDARMPYPDPAGHGAPLPGTTADVPDQPVSTVPVPSAPDPALPGPAGTGPAASPRFSPPRPPVWERPQFVARLLAVVGAGITLIGIAFLLVLAAQYGFFGPLARTLAAAGLGVVLLAIAFWVHGRSPDNPGAPALAATGVASGFLSVVAATVIYGWLPPWVGLALVAALGLFGLALARRWENEVLAVVAVGASLVLAPFVGAGEPVVTSALMVAMTGVTQWLEGGRGWRVFPLLRVLPTAGVLLYVVISGSSLEEGERFALVALALILVGVSLAGVVTARRETQGLFATRLGLVVAAAVPAVFAPALLDSIVLQALAFWVVAVAFTVVGALPSARPGTATALLPLGALFLFLTVFALTEQRYVGAIAMGMAIAYLAAGLGAQSRVSWLVGLVLGAVALLSWLPQVTHVLGQAAAVTAAGEDVLRSVLGVPLGVLAYFGVRRFFWSRPADLYVAWAVSLATGSVAVVELATLVGRLLQNPTAGFQLGQFLVTSSWMLLCVLLLRRGLASTRDRAEVWLRLALVLAGLALAKLFLLDLSMLDAIARVGAFLVVGLLLLFVGTRYAKAWERARAADPVLDAAAVGPSGDGPTGAPLGRPPAR